MESSTGVKILSSNPRALVAIQYPPPAAPFPLPPGLFTIQVPLPVQPVRSTNNGLSIFGWPTTRNWRFKFSASLAFSSLAGANQVSIESGAMVITGDAAAPDILASNAARLANLTALAQNATMNFDEWLVDVNDLLTLRPRLSFFNLWLYLTVNNTGAAPKDFAIQGQFTSDAAQFDNYRFTQWE